jgi:ParB family transcriptional regulator, chromosome partitioning protein
MSEFLKIFYLTRLLLFITQDEHTILGSNMETKLLRDLKVTNPYSRLGTDVSELEKSISTLGLIAPLVISKDDVLLAGARRYQALLNLGITEAPVLVIDKGELEMELISIDENLVRKDLTKLEIESHLRRAKEIYQALNQEEDEKELAVQDSDTQEAETEVKPKLEVLPAQKFLNMVSEKTGLSPKQIHEAISRDEKSSPAIKEARKNGKLSLSQANEIIKLDKEEQDKALPYVRELPTRELKKFIKTAKTQGVSHALAEAPAEPPRKEFAEIDSAIKKLIKKMKQLELEGITSADYPQETSKLIHDLKFMLLTEASGSVVDHSDSLTQ